MSYAWETELVRPTSLRAVLREAERVISELSGMPGDSTRLSAGAAIPRLTFGIPNLEPLPDELLDRVIPNVSQSVDEAHLWWRNVVVTIGAHACQISAVGSPEVGIITEPFRTDGSILLAVALVIAASRLAGSGIGDAHHLLGSDFRGTFASPMSEEVVLSYLREPASSHISLEDAAHAVLAKTRISPDVRRSRTAAN
jgi:hypothetical protein